MPQAAEGAKEIVADMIRTTDYDECMELAESLETLQTVKAVDPTVVEWLKGPLAVGAARDSVLKYVSRIAGQELNDLQSFTEWAEKNHPDFDLESPPENPFR